MSDETPHVQVDSDTTIWVAHGGLVGIDEAALFVAMPDDNALAVIPLTKVNEACERSKAPTFVVRWSRDRSGGES